MGTSFHRSALYDPFLATKTHVQVFESCGHPCKHGSVFFPLEGHEIKTASNNCHNLV